MDVLLHNPFVLAQAVPPIAEKTATTFHDEMARGGPFVVGAASVVIPLAVIFVLWYVKYYRADKAVERVERAKDRDYGLQIERERTRAAELNKSAADQVAHAVEVLTTKFDDRLTRFETGVEKIESAVAHLRFSPKAK
jgi:hypothetical protein